MNSTIHEEVKSLAFLLQALRPHVCKELGLPESFSIPTLRGVVAVLLLPRRHRMIWGASGLSFWLSDGLVFPRWKVIRRRDGWSAFCARVVWDVYRRDGFLCSYCGAGDVPLTVDHIVLWEQGGPSTRDNLLTSCKKCNKTRGNMSFEEWLESDHYKRVSRGLSEMNRVANEDARNRLPSIKRTPIRSR